MKLTDNEKDILYSALLKLEEYYDKREETCRAFKWICHDHLPQIGEGYTKNKNVFDIEERTIRDIKEAKENARKAIMKIINNF